MVNSALHLSRHVENSVKKIELKQIASSHQPSPNPLCRFSPSTVAYFFSRNGFQRQVEVGNNVNIVMIHIHELVPSPKHMPAIAPPYILSTATTVTIVR
jgi:hypothetical protein